MNRSRAYGAAMTTGWRGIGRVAGLVRAIVTLGIIAGVLPIPGAASAGKTGTLRLSGHVPQHATLRLSDWTLSPIALRPSAAGTRVAVTGLSVLANNRQFSVTLRSLGAIVTGRPSLIDPATGGRLPYTVSYGGTALAFAGGELDLGDALAAAAGSAELEVRLPGDARLAAGQFQDRLVLIITAR